MLEYLRSWSGKNRDIFDTVCETFALCDELEYTLLEYDADGLGAGVRGDARVINEQRDAAGKPRIQDNPFRGSASVFEPEGEMVDWRTNADFFANLKAQSWWALRMRFQAVHRAIAEGKTVDPDSIISFPPDLPELPQLLAELAQPTYSINGGWQDLDRQNAARNTLYRLQSGLDGGNDQHLGAVWPVSAHYATATSLARLNPFPDHGSPGDLIRHRVSRHDHHQLRDTVVSEGTHSPVL